MFDQTGWPVVAHNRAWSTTNVYSTTNGGEFKFAEGFNPREKMNVSIPLEEKFWHFLIGNAKKWGLINYQQDWMWVEIRCCSQHQECTLKSWVQVHKSEYDAGDGVCNTGSDVAAANG